MKRKFFFVFVILFMIHQGLSSQDSIDEVFYIGDDKCPRCRGRDKAELFAGEVRLIRDHLAQNDRELWIWGDRLIDGATTGMGMMQTVWSDAERYLDQFYGKRPPRNQDENSVACFKKLFEAMNKETIE